MFEFFIGLIENLGVKLIDNFSDKVIDFVKNIINNTKNSDEDNSGDNAQIGSSGYYTKIGSSGDNAKIGSSGYYAQIGSSGDNAKIDITGDSSIVADCGYMSKIKAKNGTWITLSEFKEVVENDRHYLKPSFMKVAQIGNKDYVDV